MWHQEMQLKRNFFDGWKIWNFTIGGKFINENPIWSFRQMPQQKAGGILQKNFHRGKWSKEEKIFHTNVLELLALKLLIITFTRNLSHLTIHVPVENKIALAYISLEEGWQPQSTAFKNQQASLELSTISSDYNYCRVASKQVECQSRLGVQECNRFIWLETTWESFS